MGIFDKLFRRNKNAETEEVEKVEEKKEEIKEEVKVESTENTENIEKVENEVVEEVTKVEEPVKVNISQRLTKSKEGFFSKLKNIFTSKSKIDDSIYEELEDLLIQSDVGLGMTTNLINDLEKKVKANKISETSEVYEILKGLMSEFLLSQDSKVHLKDNRINVILIVGREGADPASVVYDTLSKAEATKADVVIIDTAGRLHNKANLMRELEKINNIIKKKIGEQEYESLLVIDGTTGQNGLNQAKEFNSVTDLTGFIVTKLDGTAKGGIVFSVSEELKKPIKFIGLGEKIEDLIEFNAKDFVEAIFN